MIHKTILTIATATIMSAALISTQLSAQASVNPAPVENNLSKVNFHLVTLDVGLGFDKTVTHSSDAAPMLVAWSIKSAVKKAAKGVKKIGKEAGRGIRRANRVIVPSEIRNAASAAKRRALKAGRFIAKHPYGRRCKPGKFLAPVCKVKGKRAPITRDHRKKTKMHDHRTTRTN